MTARNESARVRPGAGVSIAERRPEGRRMQCSTVVSTVLARLEHVHEIRPGQWRAKCPAHDGKSRDSLSLAETGDGRRETGDGRRDDSRQVLRKLQRSRDRPVDRA